MLSLSYKLAYCCDFIFVTFVCFFVCAIQTFIAQSETRNYTQSNDMLFSTNCTEIAHIYITQRFSMTVKQHNGSLYISLRPKVSDFSLRPN